MLAKREKFTDCYRSLFRQPLVPPG
jgi:hypothetical protein